MATAQYKFSQQHLYTVAQTALNSLQQHLQSFNTFKPKYNATYIANTQALLNNARLMPDNQARSTAYKVAHIQLIAINQNILITFQSLKRYIIEAFPKNKYNIMLQAAGQSYYRKASHRNWQSTKGLLTSASQFIANYQSQLSVNQNMPPTFQAHFLTLKTSFENQHQQFLQAEEKVIIQTHQKIKINNYLYKTITRLCLDGQEIFRHDEATRKQFIISEISQLASGPGTAGFKGKITNSHTNQPIPNVTLTIHHTNKTETTNPQGRYTFTQLAAGNYIIIIEKEGYQTQTLRQQVNTGIISKLNIQLKPPP